MTLDLDLELRRIGRRLEASSSVITPDDVRRHEPAALDIDDELPTSTAVPADGDPVYVESSSPAVRPRRSLLAACAVAAVLLSVLGVVATSRDRSVSTAPAPAYWLPGWLPAGYEIADGQLNVAMESIPAIVASSSERGLIIQWLPGSAVTPMAFTDPLTVDGLQGHVIDLPTGGVEISVDHAAGGVLDLQGHGWNEDDLRKLTQQAASTFTGDLAALTRLVPSDMTAQLVPGVTALAYVMFTDLEHSATIQVERSPNDRLARTRATFPKAVTTTEAGDEIVETGTSPGVTTIVRDDVTLTVAGDLAPADRLRIAQSIRPVDETAWRATTERTVQPTLDVRCSGAEPPADAARGDLGGGAQLSAWVCDDVRRAQYMVGDVFGPLMVGIRGLTTFQDLNTSPPSAVLFGVEPKEVTRVVVHLADGGVLDASPLDVVGFAGRVWFTVVPGGMVDVRAVDSYAGDRRVDHQGRPTT